jgi:nucleoside-diphosphate-sugar epimerase
MRRRAAKKGHRLTSHPSPKGSRPSKRSYRAKAKPSLRRLAQETCAITSLVDPIYGAGSQTRSFCYVDDLIDGFIRLMKSPKHLTGPVNLGNPKEFTIKELAELVIDMTGSKSKLSYEPLPQDDPKQRQPDIALAKRELSWSPRIALREGLKQTIDYFDQLISERLPKEAEAAE